MTGLLIKVEHHPEDSSYPWVATMWRDLPKGVEYVSETTACAATRDEAIRECKAKYDAGLTAEPTEWLHYDLVPEPQSLKA